MLCQHRIRKRQKEWEREKKHWNNWFIYTLLIHLYTIFIWKMWSSFVLFCSFFFCLFEFDFDINMICYSLRYVDIKLPETEIHSNDKIYRSDSSICDIFSEVINLFQVFILELELEWSSKSCCSFFFLKIWQSLYLNKWNQNQMEE